MFFRFVIGFSFELNVRGHVLLMVSSFHVCLATSYLQLNDDLFIRQAYVLISYVDTFFPD